MALATKVASRVNLESVKLMGCSCKHRLEVPDGPKAFAIKRGSEFTVSDERDSIGVVIRFGLKAFPKDDAAKDAPPKDENAFLTIAATFLLLYSIKDADDLSDDAFRSFAELNGTYNAWPYWREFVQSMTTRMDLPTLTIPVFRLPCAPAELPSAQETPAETPSAQETPAERVPNE